jgi:nitrate reductase gamma subunit
VFKAHMFLGMTIFLVFPFTRLVHIWSGFAAIGYAFRSPQIVRTKRRISATRPAAPQPAATPARAPAPTHAPQPAVASLSEAKV